MNSQLQGRGSWGAPRRWDELREALQEGRVVKEFPLTKALRVETKLPSPRLRLPKGSRESTRHSKQREAQAPLALPVLGQPHGGAQGIGTNRERDVVSTKRLPSHSPHACPSLLIVFTFHSSSTSLSFPVRAEDALFSFPFPVTQPQDPHPRPCWPGPSSFPPLDPPAASRQSFPGRWLRSASGHSRPCQQAMRTSLP